MHLKIRANFIMVHYVQHRARLQDTAESHYSFFEKRQLVKI
jgi:hypothetical protein